MRRPIAAAVLCVAFIAGSPALCQDAPFPLPREATQPVVFFWSGPVDQGVRALATRIGYASWVRTASGLPIEVPPRVDVSVQSNGAPLAQLVEDMNRSVRNKAVIVLDPDQRLIGVVFYD